MDKHALIRPVIAVDIGTTSTKTLAVARSGKVLAAHAIEYPLLTPSPDIAEQDPLEIFAAVIAGVKETVNKAGISAENVLCVSFSSAMHSLIAVDERYNPLTRCITWADNRGAAYVAELNERHEGRRLHMETGTPIHPMSPLLKLMWLKDREPDIYKRAYKFMGIKEFVIARLFGVCRVDYSIASATGLFNLKSLSWDSRALAAAGLSEDRLCEPVPVLYRLQGLEPELADRMGLHTDTPFVIGASDGVLANLAVSATEPGVVSVSIGTSGAVRGAVNKPVSDPLGRLFCYALTDDYWVSGGSINNGGIMLRWVRDRLAAPEAEEARRLGQDPYDYLIRMASEAPPGSGGLLFMPFLAGERAPFWNADARGLYFGLSMSHEKRHMIRAVLEGVVYRIHSVLTALSECIGETVEVRASGGFARSALWRQMMADVLGIPVTVPDMIESSALGAAQLGFMAMGQAERFEDFVSWSGTSFRHEPNMDNHAVYKELLPIFMSVYRHVTEDFTAISDFQRKYRETPEC